MRARHWFYATAVVCGGWSVASVLHDHALLAALHGMLAGASAAMAFADIMVHRIFGGDT